MDYNPAAKEIHIEKVLNELDKFTIDFISILQKYADYVIVSGYVSILLGRTRGSEDVDLLIPPMAFSSFESLFSELLSKKYECANTSIVGEAYELLDEHAIRFFREGVPVPNIEFKKISSDIQRQSFQNRIKVILPNATLFVSPLELQIAYKLSLMSDMDIKDISSDKDFEDAKHLYELFKEKLNKEEMLYFVGRLCVERKFKILKNE